MKPKPLEQAVTLDSDVDWRAFLASAYAYIEFLVEAIAEAIAKKIEVCPGHWLGCTSLMNRDLCIPDEHAYRSFVRHAF